MCSALLLLLLPLAAAQGGGRVFLRAEEPGQEGLLCTSLPGLEPAQENIYFACTCTEPGTRAKFSLATFAHQLDPSIFNRKLVVDFRDCWALALTMDQRQLSTPGPWFRPDINFLEINLENMYHVQLVQDPVYRPGAELVNPPAHQLTVRLFEVNKVTVDTEADLDRLVTEWEATKLQVDLTTADTDRPDHSFDIAGFLPRHVFFLTSDREVALQEGHTHFRAVLQDLRHAVLARARQMSLGLALCCAVLALGLGAGLLALVRRHQLLLESIYSGLGSLRRGGGRGQGEEGGVTTTTKVEFFPRYSIVNKSRRALRAGVLPSSLPETEKKDKDEKKENVEKKEKDENKEKDSKTVEAGKPKQPHVPSTYSIFSTLKFPPKRPPLPPPPTTKPAGTSFYYKEASSSSNYDLTLVRGEKEEQVVAEVHRPEGGGSPAPLLPPRGRQEGVYSFRTLQERCRKMIQGAVGPWQANTKL